MVTAASVTRYCATRPDWLWIVHARTGLRGIAVYNSQFAGRISFFCEEAADAGVATLFFVNDSGSGHDVAPPGGTDGRISTNPIAAGVPRAKAPHLVLDIATSTVAMGRLSEWRDRGEVIPAEWVTPTGVLKPFGGFKGFGFGARCRGARGGPHVGGYGLGGP